MHLRQFTTPDTFFLFFIDDTRSKGTTANENKPIIIAAPIKLTQEQYLISTERKKKYTSKPITTNNLKNLRRQSQQRVSKAIKTLELRRGCIITRERTLHFHISFSAVLVINARATQILSDPGETTRELFCLALGCG